MSRREELRRKLIYVMRTSGFTPQELEEMLKEVATNSKQRTDSDWSEEITELISYIILQMGIPAHIEGYEYIKEGILYLAGLADMHIRITKELYPHVAEVFNTTSARVEREIRYAIEVGWGRGDTNVFEEYFGNSINEKRGNPTNAEFLYAITDKIKPNSRK